MSENLEEQKVSLFDTIPEEIPSESYIIQSEYNTDNNNYKINLASSFYRNENGNSHVFPVIRNVEKILANDPSLIKEELHPFGYESIRRSAIKLILGDDLQTISDIHLISIQTLSTTGALRIGAEFLANILNCTIAYSSSISKSIESIFLKAGFKEFKYYRYITKYKLSLYIDGFLEDLNKSEVGSVIILQPSAHNPTGFDLNKSDWYKVADIIINRKLIPFFDCAYQGYASGNLDQDVWPIRYFTSRNIEFFCAYSLSKIFNIYSERIGCLIISTINTDNIHAIYFHLHSIIKNIYATPPSHGARVIAYILGDTALYNEWLVEIESIAKRLKLLRSFLKRELSRQHAPGNWEHIIQQKGMFCYTGLVDIQIEYLKVEHHIYLLPSGRLNISGLNTENIEYVAFAIKLAMEKLPQTFDIPGNSS